MRPHTTHHDDCGCKTGRLLTELFIPALRYYLPRRSALAMGFPQVCRRVWADLSTLDREVALRDIKHAIAERQRGDVDPAMLPYWQRFVEWAERGGEG